MHNNDELRYAEMFSKWYSWGSPIGLSIFFINMAFALFIGISVFDKMRSMYSGSKTTAVVERSNSAQAN